jgi:dUTP pyrophosphatase
MRVFAVQRLSLAAKLPERAYKSAGYDLFSLKDTIIWPKQLKIIPIGIAIEFDEDHVGLIWDKTSGANRNLHVRGGVMDSDYRGEWGIMLYNAGWWPKRILAGKKVAQVLFQKIEHGEPYWAGQLHSTHRGAGCLGSSGA